MAPNKKKKKPANNPARGFATTSIVSKSKALEDEPPVEEVDETVASDTGSQGPFVAKPSCDLSEDSKDLSKLAPEELERQLEESELQMLVDKYAEKVTKDVKRQMTKLESERRLLRGHAEELSISWWLPEEILILMTNRLKDQIYTTSSSYHHENKPLRSCSLTENLTVQIWTLKRTLGGLGFTHNRVQDAISFLLTRKFPQDANTPSSNRDALWGLDECMDWLALMCTYGEMPDYNKHITNSKVEEASQAAEIEFTSEPGKQYRQF